jgi:flagellin
LAGYSASLTSGAGNGVFTPATDNISPATLANGAAPGGLDTQIVLEISGTNGAEVLSFGAGSSLTQIVAGINGVSDATGVSASDVNGDLVFTSLGYGSAALVSVKVLDGDDNGIFAGGLTATRDTGTDIVATVNGIAGTGTGNSLVINTATLDLTLAVDAGSSTDVNFTIAGGGALFQLGPDVVSNQQARIGITSVNTAKLGGVSGKLFQLGSGGSASLVEDTTTAGRIVEEAINQITSLRGRLGAFQRTTLETNKQALNDTLVNLTEAESQIRDSDFAEETAALTRAQILVQSGTVVLQISNQNPQNVLALLQ